MIFYKRQKEITKLQKLINLHEGSLIADIGTGKGFYALGFAKIVGNFGKVYATEFNSNLLINLGSKIKANKIINIELIESGNTHCNLPKNSVDYIFLRGVYHHLSNHKEFNTSLFNALKPNGVLIIVDFAPKILLSIFSPVKNTPLDRGGHGIKKEVLTKELIEAGFNLKQVISNWVWGRYCLLFNK